MSFRFPHRPREVAGAAAPERVALEERRDRELEDYLDSLSGGTRPWLTGTRDCTQNLGTGADTGTWTIDYSVGDWSTDGENISVPEYGIYAWDLSINWNASSSLDGTSRPSAGGIAIGWWRVDVQAIASHFGGSWDSGIPVFYSGSGDFDQTHRYHDAGVLPVGFDNSATPDVYVYSKFNPASWVGTPSGTIEWTETLVMVQLSTGVEP